MKLAKHVYDKTIIHFDIINFHILQLPLFTLELFLTKTGIEFNNTQSDFNSYVSYLMENWKSNMVTNISPLLFDKKFDDFAW